MRLFKSGRFLTLLGVCVLIGLFIILYSIVNSNNKDDSSVVGVSEDTESQIQEEIAMLMAKLTRYDDYEFSDLTENDLRLTSFYSIEDIEKHARLILGVIDDESRQLAVEGLPISETLANENFGSGDNIYYGLLTDNVIIETNHIGFDYPSTDGDYNAIIVADVTKSSHDDVKQTETVTLRINYNRGQIENWFY